VVLDRDDNLAGTGLSMSSTGAISGTPSSAGPIQFVASATDEVGASAEQPFSFNVNNLPHVTTGVIPDATAGEAYSFSLQSQFGTAPFSWSNPDGNLAAAGLSLSPAGAISGTPPSDATLQFTARVTDATGAYDEKQFDFTIKPPYVCGDADGSDAVAVSDAVYIINYIFAGGPAPAPLAAADADCSGNISVGDAVFIIDYIFGGGAAPCSSCP
jgi:hypothetical protein